MNAASYPTETREYGYDPSLASWRDEPCAYADCGVSRGNHVTVGGYAYCPLYSPLPPRTTSALRQYLQPRRAAKYACGCDCSLSPSQPDPDYVCHTCRKKAEKAAEQAERRAARKQARERGEVVAVRDRAPSIYADLPTIVDVYWIDDAGEYGAALFPHCGAEGRYTYAFAVAGSTETFGAMRGCFGQFPKHAVVDRIAGFVERMAENKRRGWSPSRFDQRIQTALDAFRASGHADPDALLATFRAVDRDRAEYRSRR